MQTTRLLLKTSKKSILIKAGAISDSIRLKRHALIWECRMNARSLQQTLKIISRSIFCCLKIHHVEEHFISPYLKTIITHFEELCRNLYCSKCSSEWWFLRKIGDLDHWLYSTVFSRSVTYIYSLLGCAIYHLRFWLCGLYKGKTVLHTLVMTCSITEQNVQSAFISGKRNVNV